MTLAAQSADGSECAEGWSGGVVVRGGEVIVQVYGARTILV